MNLFNWDKFFYYEKTQEYLNNQVYWSVYTDKNIFDNSYYEVTGPMKLKLKGEQTDNCKHLVRLDF